jgi:hypothetical protein
MKKYLVTLTQEERQTLHELIEGHSRGTETGPCPHPAQG